MAPTNKATLAATAKPIADIAKRNKGTAKSDDKVKADKGKSYFGRCLTTYISANTYTYKYNKAAVSNKKQSCKQKGEQEENETKKGKKKKQKHKNSKSGQQQPRRSLHNKK